MVVVFWAQAIRNNPLESWSNIQLWKMDLRGACTLLSYRPENAGLFEMMLTDYLVYLQIAGIFRWSGTPPASKLSHEPFHMSFSIVWPAPLSCTSMT